MGIIKGSRSLGELRAAHKTKASFNKAMRMDAKVRLIKSGKEQKCVVCGAKENLNVHHIRPICSFADSDLIEKINAPSNLKFLCELHHNEVHYGH